MLKKTITYTDYNGNERTEDHYFNLTEAEIAEMELSVDGGLAMSLKKIIAAQDIPSLVQTFKELILKSYGEKSADGKRFVKSEEISKAFEQTDAYSVLFMELINDAEACNAFIKGVMPQEALKALGYKAQDIEKVLPILYEIVA